MDVNSLLEALKPTNVDKIEFIKSKVQNMNEAQLRVVLMSVLDGLLEFNKALSYEPPQVEIQKTPLE